MQVSFVDEHKGKRRHRERQQRFFLCVQGLLLLQVSFLCLLQKFYQHPTSQGSEFWSWQRRNGDFKLVPIPSIHPLWSFSFFYSGTEEVLLNFFAFGFSCSLNSESFLGVFFLFTENSVEQQLQWHKLRVEETLVFCVPTWRKLKAKKKRVGRSQKH